MNRKKRRATSLFVVVPTLSLLAAQYVEARPIPVGESLITISYETPSGLQTFSGLRNYLGSGPTDATVFPGAPNIAAFNSAQTFGRRLAVAQNPAFSAVMQPGETLMSHAFFKRLDNLTGDYFPDIPQDGTITVKVENILFDQPVMVDPTTVLLHTLWNDQNKQLEHPYHHIHNIHTLSADFRDTDLFLGAGEFANLPHPNFILADSNIEWLISGDGTMASPLTIMASFPYGVLRNLEEDADNLQHVPDGLPAPHGFLEPWHFHLEYTVVPEPGTLALLLIGGFALLRRRGQSGLKTE